MLGVLVSLAAWKAGALSASGAVAAALVGGLVFGLGGLTWALLLLAFFISSSALSLGLGRRKTAVEREFVKGGRRDAGQVLANGGLGALLAVGHALLPGHDWIWVAFAGTLAAVNADTWSTELGVLSRTPPRRVTTGRVVPAGTSGAVSTLGLLAGLGGSFLIALLAGVWATGLPTWTVFGAVILGGLAGSLVDSLLGASLQGIYYCPVCAKETERHPRHSCGTQTVRWRGWSWLDNDRVNLICAMAGGLAALGLYWLL